MKNGNWVENLMEMYWNYIKNKEKDEKDKSKSLKGNDKSKSLKKNNESKSLKKIPIKTLTDFLNKYSISSWPNSWNYNDIHYSLKKLEKALKTNDWNGTSITDPIEYLHYLYFEKRHWAPTIFKEVWKFFHYDDYSKLNYLFKEIFSWKVRKNWENTSWKISVKEINNRRIKKETKETKEMINDILSLKEVTESNFKDSLNRKNFPELSEETLNELIYSKVKMLKILWVISWKDEEKIKEIIISTRQNWTWATMIAKEIQELFDTLWFTEVKITKYLIQKMK